MSKHLRIGIAGLGTVGAGVLKILTMHQGMLEARAGCRLTVKAGARAIPVPRGST